MWQHLHLYQLLRVTAIGGHQLLVALEVDVSWDYAGFIY